MRRNLNVIIDWVIIISLLIFCLYPYLVYGSFSAEKAHNKSEKAINYGPSDTITKLKIGNSNLFLCRYGKYISADIVERGNILWFPQSKPYILPIDNKESINYFYFENNLKGEYPLMCIFGIINDSSIKAVKLYVKDSIENTLKTIDFQIVEGKYLFLFWDEKHTSYNLIKLQCFDSNKNNIYEKDLETLNRYNLIKDQ